jgi:hypothetical protein
MYAEAGNDGTKSRVLLTGTPGTKDFATAGTGPVRGMEVMDGVLYAVSGTILYSISDVGTASSLGVIPGTDTVTLANNGTQLCVVAGGNGYIYNKDTLAFTQITDPDFSGADSVTYIDGYFIFNDGSKIFSSDLLDGTSYQALNFANADYDPDTALRVFADHSELWIFGPNSIEPWYNIGGSSFPFAPRQGTAIETGLLSKNAVVKQDNAIFWFGIDARGGRVVYRSNGYNAVRISTHALEKKWDEFANPENAVMFSYSQEGHAFVILVLPASGTYVYDAATNEWHERETFGDNDWRMRNFALAYNKRLVGDSKTGKIFELDLDTFTENAGTIERIVMTNTIASPNQSFMRHNRLRVDFDGGVGTQTGAGANPNAALSWVNDGQRDFTNEKLSPLGKIGEYSNRTQWKMLGKARSRVYKLRVTAPVQVNIKGMYLWARPGAGNG